MGNSLKDAFDRAKKSLGGDTVDGKRKTPIAAAGARVVHAAPTLAFDSGPPKKTPAKSRQPERTVGSVKVSVGKVTPRSHGIRQLDRPLSLSDFQRTATVSSAPVKPKVAKVVRSMPPSPKPRHSVSVAKDATCALGKRAAKTFPLLSIVEMLGRASQAYVGRFDERREVVLGLDFGTSCVKVVIGDSALGKSFAVPFCKAEGVGRFLLPSRLCETGKSFSLDSGTHVYRDLKLSLLADSENPTLQLRVVAFLALVIRRARGWLLLEHASIYQRTEMVWKLAIGLPAAQHHQTPLSTLFEHLGRAAWTVADSASDVTELAIRQILAEGARLGAEDQDLEVSVVPEIAAQIYGFVASNSFDKKAANIYLMADVGAGTVDSSLFRVKPGKGGRWDFEFYTSVVEPNGVSNLHRHRVNWWSDELAKVNAPKNLVADLNESKLNTDLQISSPETFYEYFDGVQVSFQAPGETPDAVFFDQRVLTQVQGKTLWRTWKDNLLSRRDLENIPFFMCGGGTRMRYYQALEERTASMPGYSWLKAECWVMGVPDDLQADGLPEEEYDRLSVAYGLSRLEVGKIVKAMARPKLVIDLVNTWRENYVDKDLC